MCFYLSTASFNIPPCSSLPKWCSDEHQRVLLCVVFFRDVPDCAGQEKRTYTAYNSCKILCTERQFVVFVRVFGREQGSPTEQRRVSKLSVNVCVTDVRNCKPLYC